MKVAAADVVGLAIFSGSLAIGQLMFKKAGLSIRGLPLLDALWSLAALPIFYAALFLYGFSTLLWVWILSRVPLNQAYPWAASAMVIVPLLAGWFLGEKAKPVFWLGAALIFVGIIITQYGVED